MKFDLKEIDEFHLDMENTWQKCFLIVEIQQDIFDTLTDQHQVETDLADNSHTLESPRVPFSPQYNHRNY